MGANSIAATAFHEAGHVAACFELGLRVYRVSIEPDESRKSLGRIVKSAPIAGLMPEQEIVALLAGGVAEEIYTREFNRAGCAHDLADANNLAQNAWPDASPDSIKDILDALREQARVLLTKAENWSGVDLLARALIERRTLSCMDAAHVFVAGQKLPSQRFHAARHCKAIHP